MILFINCCPREESRTRRLADALLDKLTDGKNDYEEVDVYKEDLQPLDEAKTIHRHNQRLAKNFDDPIFKYAKQFAAADIIVMAAPYWDFSFPSKLKVYIENIYANDVVSAYREDGSPQGLCKAGMLYYVTTAGGPYDPRFSYDYIREMTTVCFGVKETKLIKAEMLDVIGQDPEAIVKETIDHMQL